MKRVFVVGCPRSGTTLLQGTLAAHDAVSSFPESHFLPSTQARNPLLSWIGFTSRHAHGRLVDFLDQTGYKDVAPSRFEFGLTQRAAVSSFAECLDEISEEEGSRVWVEKTPRHLWYVDTIEKYIESPKVIHVLREGKDVIASLYHVTNDYPERWNGKKTIGECIRRWNQDISISEGYKHNNNHFFINYGNMVNEPRKFHSKIFSILGLERPSYQDIERRRINNADRIVKDDEDWKKNSKEKIKKTQKKFDLVLTDEQRKKVLEKKYDSCLV